MRIVARKVDESQGQVRYSFGLDERFDRVLIIEKSSWEISTAEGDVDSVAGKIAMKIKNAWRESGDFPPGAVFAS
jgi:hypothetical protein